MAKNAHTDRYTIIKEFATPWPHATYLAHPIHNPEQQVLLKTFRFTDPAEGELAYSRTCDLCVLNHPSILPLLDYDSDDESFYLARPFFLSGSLRTLLMLLQSERLMIDECIHILSHVGKALDYAHELGLVHGRISANNVLIDDHGNIFLTDFPPLPHVSLSNVSYTPETFLFSYTAPEQFDGTTSEKSDQYALACLVYELLTGQLPFGEGEFDAMRNAHCFEEPIPLIEIAPDVPYDLNTIVLRALSKSPADRYPDIKSFVSALDSLWSKTSLTPPVSDTISSSPKAPAPHPTDNGYNADTIVAPRKNPKKKKRKPPMGEQTRPQDSNKTSDYPTKKKRPGEHVDSASNDDPLLKELYAYQSRLNEQNDLSSYESNDPFAKNLSGPLPALPVLDLLAEEPSPDLPPKKIPSKHLPAINPAYNGEPAPDLPPKKIPSKHLPAINPVYNGKPSPDLPPRKIPSKHLPAINPAYNGEPSPDLPPRKIPSKHLPAINPVYNNAPLVLPPDVTQSSALPDNGMPQKKISSSLPSAKLPAVPPAIPHSENDYVQTSLSNDDQQPAYHQISHLPDQPFILFPSDNAFTFPPIESLYPQDNSPLMYSSEDTSFLAEPEPNIDYNKNNLPIPYTDKSTLLASPEIRQPQNNPSPSLPSSNLPGNSTYNPLGTKMEHNVQPATTINAPLYPPQTNAPIINPQYANIYSSRPLVTYPQKKSSSRHPRRKRWAISFMIIFITGAFTLLSGTFFYYTRTTDNLLANIIPQLGLTTTQKLKITPTPTTTVFILTTSNTPEPTATPHPKISPTPSPSATASTKVNPTPTSSAPLTTSQIYNLATSGTVLTTLPTIQAQANQNGTVVLDLDSNLTVGDFAFQADLTTQGDSGGLVFHTNTGSNQGDRFLIGTDGSYNFENTQTMLASGKSSAIIQGQNKKNLVTVIEKGQKIYLYINKKFVTKVTDSDTPSTGEVGCIAADFTNTTTTNCSNATVYTLPSSFTL